MPSKGNLVPTRKTMIVTAVAAAALVLPAGAAFAAATAADAEAEAVPAAPPTKAEARAAAAQAVALARTLQRGPDAEAAALAAAKQAGPAAQAAIAEATAATYTPAYAKSYAKSYMKKKYGWGAGEFSALVEMWNLESQWDYRAENATSGAYGIPQALPADKMASHGKDWRTNPEPQIRWGLAYISSTYGSPSAALSFWHANNWY
ncbi:MAG: hypothetical protein U0R64_00410 [Candidatus Nanopelagicales bacterium]